MDSDPQLERRVLDLIQVLLDLPEDERIAWIHTHSEIDSPLRQRLMAMLQADRLANLRTGGAGDGIMDDNMPERIGAYRIIARIGRGGMGAVYRGERMTGDFAHTAAIKLIKPGLLSEKLVDRFQRERQTLANLEHPYIARLYDGGETAEGAPFMVMEHIDGEPILDWADAHGLSRDDRLRLFGHVCEAVAHAHRNLVVHRDITPSNVLVTRDGTVKLIDFGIAKPAHVNAEAETRAFNSIASLTLTPGYAAPERMISGDATTSGDLYSLGKLLAALHPPGSDAELAAIVDRATAAEPADRYPTADALRADIEALRGNFPVTAVAGGRRYLARKFVQRHRLGVIAASMALGLLLTAFGGTLWALDRTQAARTEAEMRFGQLRSLANYMVFDLNGKMARTVGNGATRRGLVDRAQTYLSALAVSPKATPDIKLEAARGLISLASIQGVPNAPNFGNRERARANLDAAIAQLQGVELPQAATAPDLAAALVARAMIEAHADTRIQQAADTVAKADAALGRVAPAGRGERWLEAQSAVSVAQLELAVLGQDAGRIMQRAALLDAQTNAWPVRLRPSRAATVNHALADYYRGIGAMFSDEIDKSVAFEQVARDRFARLDAERPNDPNLLYQYLWVNYVGFGAASGQPGHEKASDEFLRTSRSTIDRLIALEPNDTSLYMFRANVAAAEAQALSEKRKYQEAEAMQRSVVSFLTEALGRERKPGTLNRLVIARLVLGNIASQAGNTPLACASYRDARTLLSQLEAKKLAVGTTVQKGAGLDRNIARCKIVPVTQLEQLGSA